MARFFTRMVAVFLACILCVSLAVVPVSAAGFNVETIKTLCDIGEFLYPHLIVSSNTISSWFNNDVCPDCPNTDGRHNFVNKYTKVDGVVGSFDVCEYCGEAASNVFDEVYERYVSTLDSTTVTSSGSSSGSTGSSGDEVLIGYQIPYGDGMLAPEYDMDVYPYAYFYLHGGFDSPIYGLLVSSEPSTARYSTVSSYVVGDWFPAGTSYLNYLYGNGGFVLSDSGVVADEGSGYGDLNYSSTGSFDFLWANYDVYYKDSDEIYLSGTDLVEVYGTENSIIWESANGYLGSYTYNDTPYYKISDTVLVYDEVVGSTLVMDIAGEENSVAISSDLVVDNGNGIVVIDSQFSFITDSVAVDMGFGSGGLFLVNADYIGMLDGSSMTLTWNYTSVSSDSSAETPSADTRPASWTTELDTHNTNNDYTQDSTAVNYYIAPVPDSDGVIGELISPKIFYEFDSYVEGAYSAFWCPVTESSHAVRSWDYRYDTRTYALIFEEGSAVVIDGVSCPYARITYGDDYLTVEYVSSIDTEASTYEVAHSASFAYVLATQNECNITGHTYTYETTQESTCTATGVRTYTCSECGNQYAEDIPTTDHVYKYSVDREATCTTDGIILYTCTGCGTQYTETVPATGSHSYSYSIQTPATCTTPGVGLYACIWCGASYTEDIPSGGGHEYGYTVSRDPTCTSAGTGLYTCSKCGDQYTEEIAMIDHVFQLVSFVPAEYDDEGVLISAAYSVLECVHCGTQITESESEAPVEDEGWFKTMVHAIKSFAASAFTAMGTGVVKVFSSFADLISGIFDFINGTVIGGAGDFFDSFSDGSITDFFQQENEDGSTSTTLPGEVAEGLSFIPAVFSGLPAELRGVLTFGISLLFLLAALMLIL